VLTEPRWIPDTKISRKTKEVLDEKDGYILVEMPLKVSKFDNHEEHIRVHQATLRAMVRYGEKLDRFTHNTLYRHIIDHMNAKLQESQKEMGQAKWVLPKSSNPSSGSGITVIKTPSPPTNTKDRDEG
jgi:LmbE family N-acetylglucosaminyl deacetylase